MGSVQTPVSIQDGVIAFCPAFVASRLFVMSRMQGATMPVGVVLSLASDNINSKGEGLFALLLVDADDGVLGQLGPYADDDVIAVWRDVAAKSGLDPMIVCDDGSFVAVSRKVGRVMLGATCTRRYSVVDGRRPRFLAKRQTGTFVLRRLQSNLEEHDSH